MEIQHYETENTWLRNLVKELKERAERMTDIENEVEIEKGWEDCKYVAYTTALKSEARFLLMNIESTEKMIKTYRELLGEESK